MKHFLLVAAAAFVSVAAAAADGEYAVDKIPAALLKHAHVIIRNQEQSIELRNLEKMVVKDRFVITVLDEEGDRFAYLVEHYNRFVEIDQMDGVLYDAFGRKIKDLKKGDIKDQSMSDGMSLALDDRMKFHNFYHKNYPYTVAYESQVTRKATMFFPSWNPVYSYNVAVEKSSMHIIVPRDYQVRYKCYNTPPPQVKDERDGKSLHWEVANVSALQREYASPSWHELSPFVMLAPSEFQVEDYKGNMKDWKEFGKFVFDLKKGQDVLPENVRQKVHQLTDNLKSPQEKVKVLYQYLQDNTRYISIQLGIGSWRPFDAASVATNAYGDCKALSNYMVAMLKEAGVHSFYTLVNAGDDEDDIIADFPSQQFNHVIACVPLAKDTMWLECTSQTVPAGYMGDFTGNRHALLISEQGGTLVKTPKYTEAENLQLRRVTAAVDPEGNIKASIATTYTAVQQDGLHKMINGLSREKVLEYLKSEIDLPNYDVVSFDYKQQKDKIPVISEKLEITGAHYASVSGKRLFVTPNVLTRSVSRLRADSTRKYDMNLGYAFRDVDTVEIQIPAGYKPEAVPADVKVESKFGKYQTSVKIAENKILYYRLREQYNGRFPAKDCNELVKFFDQMYKADRSRVVMVKSE